VSYSAANLQVEEVYSYDANDRLSTALYSLKNGSTAGWIQIDARSYDTAGRLTMRGADLPGPSSWGNSATLLQWFNSINSGTGLVGLHLDTDRSISFTYDADGQMTSETAGSRDRGEYSVTYTHDAAGNSTGSTLLTTVLDAEGFNHYTTVANVIKPKAAEGYEATLDTSTQFTSKETSGGIVKSDPTIVQTTTDYDVNGHVSSDSGTSSAPFVITSDGKPESGLVPATSEARAKPVQTCTHPADEVIAMLFSSDARVRPLETPAFEAGVRSCPRAKPGSGLAPATSRA